MYFDPGTGSLVVQLLLAFVASITTFLIVFKNNIKCCINNFLKKVVKNKDE